MEYGEITAIRRSAKLIADADNPGVSALNVLAWLTVILLLVAVVASIFQG